MGKEFELKLISFGFFSQLLFDGILFGFQSFGDGSSRRFGRFSLFGTFGASFTKVKNREMTNCLFRCCDHVWPEE